MTAKRDPVAHVLRTLRPKVRPSAKVYRRRDRTGNKAKFLAAAAVIALLSGQAMADDSLIDKAALATALAQPCPELLAGDDGDGKKDDVPNVSLDIISLLRDTPAGHGMCCGVEIESWVLTVQTASELHRSRCCQQGDQRLSFAPSASHSGS